MVVQLVHFGEKLLLDYNTFVSIKTMPPENQETNYPAPKKSLRIPIPRGMAVITILLAIALVVSVIIWKPWQANIKASDRTISVTGTATVTATPDQYVFSPSYDFSNGVQQTALSELTSKSTDLVAKLKALGVADSSIKTDSSGYNNGSYYLPVQDNSGTFTYTLDLTITINNASLAQKVQDYLVTTNPTGNVSPSVDFSSAKKIIVQNQARNAAEKNARTQADQSATNLGFKVDKVKSVVDGSLDAYSTRPLYASGVSSGANSATPQLTVQPGQNDLSYSVGVVYYIH